MTIYFVQVFIIWASGILSNTHKSQRLKRRYIIFAFSFIILLAALRKYTIGIDLEGHYAARYSLVAFYNWSDMPEFSLLSQYGIGYCYFIKFLTLISTDVQFYITVTSLIIYGSVGFFIYKNSTDVVMSTCLFVLFCVNYMFMNIICQGLAISLVLLGYNFSIDAKRKKDRHVVFLVFILLAYLIHTSALLCFILLLFKKLKFKISHIVFGVFASIFAFLLYDKLYEVTVLFLGSEKYASYIFNDRENQASFNLQSLALFILTAIPFVIGCYSIIWQKISREKSKKQFSEDSIEKSDSFLMFMGLMAIICRLLLFRMNIINRLSYYFIPFILLLYPRTIQELNCLKYRRTARILTYVVFLIYFIWMTLEYAEVFYGTIPYEFYWQ